MRHTLLKGFKVWFAAVGLVAFAGGNPLYAQQAVSPVAPLAAPATVAPKPIPATAEQDEYRIGAQDLIEISVFQVPGTDPCRARECARDDYAALAGPGARRRADGQ